VADVGQDCEAHGVFVERLRGSAAAHTAAVLAACVLGDPRFASFWGTRIEPPDSGGETGHVFLVELRATACRARAVRFSGHGVGRAFLLRLGEGFLLNE
jgi:hypothetical protein